jgi:hypothetical protein
MATYSITLVSGPGDVRVDRPSEVYLTMFGSKASSQEFNPASTGRPEPGDPSTYRVALTDLGDVQRVRVRHEDTGVGPGCYLDRVVVRAVGTLQMWEFVCQEWLARQKGDGATERTLDVMRAGPSGALVPPLPR